MPISPTKASLGKAGPPFIRLRATSAARRGTPLGAALVALAWLASGAAAGELQLLQLKPDPYGFPRPSPGETHVPTATSIFLEIGFDDKNTTDTALADTVAARIGPQGGSAVEMLKPGMRFADGFSGKVFPVSRQGQPPAIAVYIDPQAELKPSTAYVVSAAARSRDGAVLDAAKGSWQFTTEDAAATHTLRYPLDLAAPAVRWRGGFFIGFCKPSFCTSVSNRFPEYELMDRIREQSPKAWSLQRDFSLTNMERQPEFLSGGQPNIVRERETRRIAAMEKRPDGTLLRVEDFFGCQQYGIAPHRPLAGDYHPGDEVLIADGIHSARAKVVDVVEDSADARSLLVTPFDEPAGGWRIAYAGALPDKEDPNTPGLFPPGGCCLIKFRPAGEPHYYWGRVDREFDVARQFHRRLVVNFTDAPGDLSVDGRNWTWPKDYAEHHEVVRAIAAHVIERYGKACLDFDWSVFNEPDLAALFWRGGDWIELQKFYDYTVDAMLRAFEDHGYDSDRVMVGGLEIGAVFGVYIENPILKDFLSHCSTAAPSPGALPYNAAFADKRLDGKRSRRVESLCRGANGRGSPCDFISVHSYNASPLMAAKLIRAKQIALEIDPQRYANLWVDSFESCPNWAPPPDVAAADSYLGNGYFPTWCADVARRLLSKAAEDPRYAYGETILTFWPWPNSNFDGANNASRTIAVDEDGDGAKDREESVAMPILNFLGLTAGMGETFWPLPEQTVGGHVVSGFASRTEGAVRVLLYSHNPLDTQSRSENAFQIALELSPAPWPNVRVREYRFDKDHNSYYRLGRQLRDRPAGGPVARPEEVDRIIAALNGADRAAQLAAIKKAASFRAPPQAILAAALQLHEKTKDADVLAAIEEAGRQIQSRQPCYRPEEVNRIRELSNPSVTKESRRAVEADGRLRLSFDLAANGANFVIIEPPPSP